MAKPEHHQVEQTTVNGVAVTITTYQIGSKSYCHISNVDPGATIARAEADTIAAARQAALDKVGGRL